MITKISEGTWRIDEPDVRFFLLEGETGALLVDTGKITTDARAIAESLTDKPIKLLNTHADLDHIACNHQFESFFMHPAEACNYYKRNKCSGRFIPLEDGEVFNLGGRALEVVLLSGHTPGSVGLIDQDRRALFCGDVVGEGCNIFLFGWHREIHAYLESLRRLEGLLGDFDVIYPSHGKPEIRPSTVSELRRGVEKLLAGELNYTMQVRYNTDVRLYDLGPAGLYCDKD